MNSTYAEIIGERYSELLRRPEWLQKRKIVLKRDGGRCVNCGSSSMLNVHHRQYHKDRKSGQLAEPWNYKLKYLVTLCKGCHVRGHQKYQVRTFKIK